MTSKLNKEDLSDLGLDSDIDLDDEVNSDSEE